MLDLSGVSEGVPPQIAQNPAADDKDDVSEPALTPKRGARHKIERKQDSDKTGDGHTGDRHGFCHRPVSRGCSAEKLVRHPKNLI